MRTITMLLALLPVLAAVAEPAGRVSAEVSTAAELRAAVENLRPGLGGTITLRPGHYVLDAPLLFDGLSSVVLRGSGWNTVVSAGGFTALRFTNCGFCEVKDLLLDGGMPPGGDASGIVFRGQSSSNRVAHCRILRFPASGIRFEGDPAAPMSSNTVRECHLISNRGAQLYSHHNNDFYIVENQFGTHEGHPDAGAVLDHSSAGSYTLNYHWDNRNALRLGPGSHYNRVENNRFEESRETGVILGAPGGGDGCWFNILSGNTFHTNSKGEAGRFDAVAAFNASDTTFTGNQVFSWDSGHIRHRNGLSLDGQCRDWVITGNIFRHHDGRAIDAPDPSAHHVDGNSGDPDAPPAASGEAELGADGAACLQYPSPGGKDVTQHSAPVPTTQEPAPMSNATGPVPLAETLPLQGFDRYDVILEPDKNEAEWWAGAPSVLRDDGVFWLACRMRTGDGPRGLRGYEVRILRSEDGVHFEKAQSIQREDVPIPGFERPALVRVPETGKFRLYACGPWQDGPWSIIRFDDADRPDQFVPTTARPVITPRPMAYDRDVRVSGYKDQVIFHDGAAWHAYCIGVMRQTERIYHFTSPDGDAWEPVGSPYESILDLDGWHDFYVRPASVVPLPLGYLFVYEGSNVQWYDPVYNIATGLAFTFDLHNLHDLTPDAPLARSTTPGPHFQTLRYSSWLTVRDELWVYAEAARPNNTNEIRLFRLTP